MALVVYLIAIVLFAVAGFEGGLNSSFQDYVAFGLAFFAAGHILAHPYVEKRVP